MNGVAGRLGVPPQMPDFYRLALQALREASEELSNDA
jgi:hypothetical protein